MSSVLPATIEYTKAKILARSMILELLLAGSIAAYFKGQIPLGTVPRNFLVANVTKKSPTSYRLVTRKSGVSPACHEEVTRKLATFRPSRQVKMVWRVDRN